MESIGRYRIVSELGRGAMGVVYHAIDPTIGRPVAIKTIRIRDVDDDKDRERLRARLFREAQSAGVLSHPNIVTIYDMDEADGLAYIAMAYVNGPTLEKILASEQALSATKMLRVLRQTALALDYAHSKGIVHRDVKPANIMTDEDGVVKVTDFGIAKITSGIHSTGTGAIVGTPDYMSPEQVQGMPVDGRSDQFSLAVITYEILTGERPFTGEHLSTVIFRIMGEDPQPAHRMNGTLTQQIDEVLRKGLSKKPQDRYMNCSALVGALEMACAESRGWKTAPAVGAPAVQTAPIDESPDQIDAAGSVGATPERGFERPRPIAAARSSRPWRVGPTLMGIAAVLAVMAFFASRAGEFPSAFGVPAPPQPPIAEPQSEPGTSGQEPTGEAAPKAAGQTNTPVPRNAASTAASNSDGASAITDTNPVLAETDAVRADGVLGKPGPSTPEPEPDGAAPPASAGIEPTAESIIRETVRIPAALPQDVWVTSNPPGARAVIDGDVSRGCATPCMMQATPGIHHLTIAQTGFQIEYRDIQIGDTAQEIPTITLRQPTGTLMLMTNPPGANVWINGRMLEQITPAQISLSPGPYTVTVARDGQSQTETIQLHESPLYLRIPLNH